MFDPLSGELLKTKLQGMSPSKFLNNYQNNTAITQDKPLK
jgi:hypothetical protein